MPPYAGPLPYVEQFPVAQQFSDCSPATGAATVIKNGPGLLYGVSVSAASTVVVYDNASAASGKKLWEGVVPAATYVSFAPSVPVLARLGITVSVSAGTCQVYWS